MPKDLTADRLRALLDYDQETGVFTRIAPRRGCRIGEVAGCAGPNGYLVIGLDGGRYLSHRLAWLHVYGCWPKDQIDHIDGIKSNNRIKNLRESSCAQNQENRALRGDSTSGYTGVTLAKRGTKWQAKIGHGGKRRHLGIFSTPELAHAAYLQAKALLHTFSRESI